MRDCAARTLRRRGAAALLALCAAVGGAAARPNERRDFSPFFETGQVPEGILRSWPELSREVAGLMISEYGRPDDYSARSLIWFGNGPWKRTVVYRDPPVRRFLGRDEEVLEQVVTYAVPDERLKPLKRFSERLRVNQAAGELSIRSDSQTLNYLTLNLAHEIVVGKRSPDDAADFLDRVVRLEKAGKTSPYISGLRFSTSAGELKN
ncbi:MAG: hypothetical protein HYZ75_12620 [Elusimicrobia bacterium]|nr:hypothetical protein [Elusimicrobiota bacterium]